MSEQALEAQASQLTKASSLVGTALERLFDSSGALRGYEKYSSTSEALMLLQLSARHIQGVLALAGRSTLLLPSACVCARSALEAAAKAAWLVSSNDPFQREARWLAHLQEEERLHERTGKRFAELGLPSSGAMDRATELRKFREGITACLPDGVLPVKHIPTVDEMLKTLRGAHVYPLYIQLSQFAHGGHAATSLYKRGSGTFPSPGETIRSSDWHLPLRVSWMTLKAPATVVLWRLGHRTRNFLPQDLQTQVERAIDDLLGSGSADA